MKRKKRKNDICQYSGRNTVNKEVILTKYAVEYVKKLGYFVTSFKVL